MGHFRYAYALLLCSLVAVCAGQGWKRYPLTIAGNPLLTFPGVEGIQEQDMGDSWFFTAPVIGQTTGRRYQIVTIFDRNTIGPGRLNFYQVSIFPYDSADFNTFTEYDLPGVTLIDQKFSATPGHLEVSFASSAGDASWTTLHTADNSLRPFVYSLHCPGTDHTTSRPFAFSITADMQKKPVAVGANTLRGNFTFYAQRKTLTYFQPGPQVTGMLTFDGTEEEIRGDRGHIDRQIFPLYSGIFTPTGRQHSHEWRQINLDNGIDLAIWRQFDRVRGNAVIDTTGTTTSFPPPSGNPNGAAPAPRWTDGIANDLTVEYFSYAKYPRAAFSTLIPPPSQNMYLPSKHVIRSKKLGMELTATYTTYAPVAQLPIEYFEGPAVWTGTYAGKQVSGFGIFESTLGLYRDWELAQVLLDSASHLPVSSFSATKGKSEVVAIVQRLRGMVSSNPAQDNRPAAGLYAKNQVIPALRTLVNDADRTAMLEIANDFVDSLAIVV